MRPRDVKVKYLSDDDEDMEEEEEEEDSDSSEETKKEREPQRGRGGSVNNKQPGRRGDSEGDDADMDEDDEEEDDEDDDEEEEEDDEEEEEEAEVETSDIDMQECERKRSEVAQGLFDLEKQFSILKEQLYRERLAQIESKLEEVKAEKANEYMEPLEELELNMREQMGALELLRQLRMDNIECKHRAEQLAAEQNLENEKQILWDHFKDQLEEKIRLLEEDKQDVDLMLWSSRSSRPKRRRADPDDPDQRRKPVAISGPFMVYMLEEMDILNDWAVVRKAICNREKVDSRSKKN